jgi:hypothetical protein
MLSLALLAALAVSSEPPDPAPPWAEPPETLGSLVAFSVGVELHGKPPELAVVSREAIQLQIERTLRARRIGVVTGQPESPHDVGFLILDVHVVAVGSATSVAWTLHASQIVQLHSGAAALGSTWEVGDLIHGPSSQIASRLHDSLQPALEELCDAKFGGRTKTPAPERVTPNAADL